MDKVFTTIENSLTSEAKNRNINYDYYVSQEQKWIDIFQDWSVIKPNKLLTKAFLRRVFLAYDSEARLAGRISRGSQRSISADIENMLAQMLSAFIKSKQKHNFTITINKRWKKRQPDLLIRREKDALAVIEVKTDLGYSRKEWLDMMIDRLNAYEKLGIPKVNFFFIVLTACNWLGKHMNLDDEIAKWVKRGGYPDNLVFLNRDRTIHPNPVKRKRDTFRISSLDVFRDSQLSSLEQVFERVESQK